MAVTVPAGTRHQSGLCCVPRHNIGGTTGGHRDNSECDVGNKKVTHYRCADNYTQVESSCLPRISECCTGMLITVGVLNNCNQDANCNQVTPVQQVIEDYLLSLVTADLVCGVVVVTAQFYEPPPACCIIHFSSGGSLD